MGISQPSGAILTGSKTGWDHRSFYSVRPLLPVYPEPKHPRPAQRRLILVRGNEVFVRTDPFPALIMEDPLSYGLIPEEPVYLGIRDDLVFYCAGVPAGLRIPDSWNPVAIRDLYGIIPEDEQALAAYAVRMLEFARSSVFCGRCGGKTRPLETERARICNACSSIVYPRISPAIIVLIKKGDEILLARSPGSPPDFFSLIAGFTEPGENLEETVHREVTEEVGITVQNLRYFGSEPWPFPDSLMVGFVAEYAGGEIRTDCPEIEEARWFRRDTLPSYPVRESISRALIKAWISREI